MLQSQLPLKKILPLTSNGKCCSFISMLPSIQSIRLNKPLAIAIAFLTGMLFASFVLFEVMDVDGSNASIVWSLETSFSRAESIEANLVRRSLEKIGSWNPVIQSICADLFFHILSTETLGQQIRRICEAVFVRTAQPRHRINGRHFLLARTFSSSFASR